MIEEIGSGTYGSVWKGKWHSTNVAIKKLILNDTNENDLNKQIEEFKSEIKLMINLRSHKNVIQLYGICYNPILIVLEFMENGNLLNLLKKKGKEFENELRNKIIKGIIAGMIHLHKEGIIHRDLSSRNILLNDNFESKISDFGYSRILKSSNNNEEIGQTKSEVGPLRWMSPESLNQKIYSKSSDIWSFGVLIWECLNSGKTPYEEYDSFQAAHLVANGSLKLELPINKPKFSSLMNQCFQINPKQRPTFIEIDNQFINME